VSAVLVNVAESITSIYGLYSLLWMYLPELGTEERDTVCEMKATTVVPVRIESLAPSLKLFWRTRIKAESLLAADHFDTKTCRLLEVINEGGITFIAAATVAVID